MDATASKKKEDTMAIWESYILSNADHLTFLIGKEEALLTLYSLITQTLENHGGVKLNP